MMAFVDAGPNTLEGSSPINDSVSEGNGSFLPKVCRPEIAAIMDLPSGPFSPVGSVKSSTRPMPRSPSSEFLGRLRPSHPRGVRDESVTRSESSESGASEDFLLAISGRNASPRGSSFREVEQAGPAMDDLSDFFPELEAGKWAPADDEEFDEVEFGPRTTSSPMANKLQGALWQGFAPVCQAADDLQIFEPMGTGSVLTDALHCCLIQNFEASAQEGGVVSDESDAHCAEFIESLCVPDIISTGKDHSTELTPWDHAQRLLLAPLDGVVHLVLLVRLWIQTGIPPSDFLR